MKDKLSRVIAVVLCLLMLATLVPMTAFAAEYEQTLTTASKKVSQLAPGVKETEVVAYDKNGDRIVYYVVNADIATNSDVLVKANYHDNDNTGNWGKATVVEQANAATAKRGYNVVASTNASYYNVSTGQPTGAFVMEGVNINGNNAGDAYNFFAIMKDGTAMIGSKGTWSQYADSVQEAIGGWTMLIKDGKICDGLSESKYPRSTVGIKADGNVVLMVADGNQSPYSVGLTYKEQAEVMYSLGCVQWSWTAADRLHMPQSLRARMRSLSATAAATVRSARFPIRLWSFPPPLQTVPLTTQISRPTMLSMHPAPMWRFMQPVLTKAVTQPRFRQR